MNKVAVLSRYKENDHTFKKILEDHGYDTIVYNKHQGENLLPNVGRESHTYIQYIINHYNNLPDEILFSQYDPLDHFHRKNYMEQRDNKHISLFLDSFLYDFICINPKDYDLYVRRHKINWIEYNKILFQDTSDAFTKRAIETSACINGVFRVSKQSILRHDIFFYQRALNMLNHHVNPDEGFYFERIWRLMFTNYGYVSNEFMYLKDAIFLFGNNIDDKEYKIRKSGAFGHIKLYHDGTISSNGLSFYQNPNEAFWTTEIQDNIVYLYIFNIMSGITSRFNITNINLDNNTRICGDYYDTSRKKIHKDFFWLQSPMWKGF